MHLKTTAFLFLALVVVLATAFPKEKLVLTREENEKPTGFLASLITPALNLIRSTTRQTLDTFKDAAGAVDTHVGTAQRTIGQIAAEIGRNALGDVIDNMRLFRGRVKRLLDVVNSAQKSIQNVMDNKEINGVFRASLLPLSVGLATLEGQVSGLNVVVNAGTNNLPETDED